MLREYLDRFHPLKTKAEVPEEAERNRVNAENEYFYFLYQIELFVSRN